MGIFARVSVPNLKGNSASRRRYGTGGHIMPPGPGLPGWLKGIEYLEDHPRTCNWLGSPPFVSHKSPFGSFIYPYKWGLTILLNHGYFFSTYPSVLGPHLTHDNGLFPWVKPGYLRDSFRYRTGNRLRFPGPQASKTALYIAASLKPCGVSVV